MRAFRLVNDSQPILLVKPPQTCRCKTPEIFPVVRFMLDLRKWNNNNNDVFGKLTKVRKGSSDIKDMFERCVIEHHVKSMLQLIRHLARQIEGILVGHALESAVAPVIGIRIAAGIGEVVPVMSPFLVAIIPRGDIDDITGEEKSQLGQFSVRPVTREVKSSLSDHN